MPHSIAQSSWQGNGIVSVRFVTKGSCFLCPAHTGLQSARITITEVALHGCGAGSEQDAQQVDEMALEGQFSRKFFLQYYFPPSCVGETGRVGAPGRREIGHGQLAERALTPIIPDAVSACCLI